MERYFLRVPDPWNNVRIIEIAHKKDRPSDACICRPVNDVI